MIQILRDNGVVLPEDNKKAKQKIGSHIITHRPGTSPDNVLSSIIKDCGFASDKKKASVSKKAAFDAMVKHSDNAALADLYFKEGNCNVGASYTKVVQAIKDFDFPVTIENALGLGKGKTKSGGC